MPRQTKTADEIDVTEHRNVLVWRRGEVGRVKRGMRRRERHEGKQQTRTEEQR